MGLLKSSSMAMCEGVWTMICPCLVRSKRNGVGGLVAFGLAVTVLGVGTIQSALAEDVIRFGASLSPPDRRPPKAGA